MVRLKRSQKKTKLIFTDDCTEPFYTTEKGHAVLYDEQGRGTFAYIRRHQQEEEEARQRAAEAEQQRLREAQEAEKERQAAELVVREQSRRKSRAREATPEQASPARNAPSPTINTKAAMAEINDMFGSTMAFDMSPRSVHSAASSGAGHASHSESESDGAAAEDDDSRTESSLTDDDEAPIPSQASHPGDFVNDSFWGPVQNQPSQSSQPSQTTLRDSRSRLMDEGDDFDEEEETPPANPNRALPESDSGPAKRLFSIPVDENEGDENAVPRNRPGPSRGGLGAKALGNAQSTPSSESESEQHQPVTSGGKFEVFSDEAEQQLPSASALGRRPLGEASRFAPMVDLMTPIVERTMEYANMTQTGYLTGDMRGARPLVEESEPEDEIDADKFFEQDQPRKRKASTASTLASVHEGSDGMTEDQELNAVLDSAEALPSQSEPIYPFTAKELTEAAARMPHIQTLPGYHDLKGQQSDRLSLLRKEAKSKARKSATQDEAGVLLDLDTAEFSVREKLGEGGFGAVFRVASTQEIEGRPSVYALKTQRPAVTWEFQQLHEVRTKLADQPRVMSSVVKPFDLYHFADESHLLLEVCDQGTLLDMVNAAPTSGFGAAGGAPGVDELLAMFFTIELLRVMQALHQVGMLHCDYKIDNCLVRLDEVPGGTRAWSTQYKSDGSEGWSHKGIKLIDYGRAIDRQLYPEGQLFLADWTPDAKDCLEVRQARPWTIEPDYYGLAGITFTLLFGKHFEADQTVETETGSALAGKPFRRYHQVELWTRLFSLLLDPKAPSDVPVAERLDHVRKDMEGWLEMNGSKAGKNLKLLLKKVEIAQLSRGR